MTDLTATDIGKLRELLAEAQCVIPPPWYTPGGLWITDGMRERHDRIDTLFRNAINALPALRAAERDLHRRTTAHTLTACGNCGCGVRPSDAIEIAGKPWCRECVQEWVDAREARDQLREATEKANALLASDKPVHEILVGLAEIGQEQEQAEADARKKAEMDAIFADCGPAADALAYLRKGLTPERLAAIDAEVAHLLAQPSFEHLERLLAEAAEHAPLPWSIPAEGCMADAQDRPVTQSADPLIVAAVNALPWFLREVGGGE